MRSILLNYLYAPNIPHFARSGNVTTGMSLCRQTLVSANCTLVALNIMDHQCCYKSLRCISYFQITQSIHHLKLSDTYTGVHCRVDEVRTSAWCRQNARWAPPLESLTSIYVCSQRTFSASIYHHYIHFLSLLTFNCIHDIENLLNAACYHHHRYATRRTMATFSVIRVGA